MSGLFAGFSPLLRLSFALGRLVHGRTDVKQPVASGSELLRRAVQRFICGASRDAYDEETFTFYRFASI
jgi:hypothetical protein